MKSLLKERRFAVGQDLQNAIEQVLLSMKLWGKWHELGAAVQRLSDHFIKGSGPTPWQSELFQAAYLLYFLPLNHARLQAVLTEIQKMNFPWAQNIIDLGSGPGTAHFAAQALGIKFDNWTNFESSHEAIELHRKLLIHLTGAASNRMKWQNDPPDFSMATVLASYALNEWRNWPEAILKASHFVIVEPSTQLAGRQLMEFRSKLIEHGFYIWAPCTHQDGCPLLIHSKRDWCHDRVHFSAPDWWPELRKFLPMSNETLTFSYLVASKNPPPRENSPHHQPARVIGDTLYEKGKIRQAVCRGSEREFLSWLRRDGEAQLLPHGQLIELPNDIEKKGNELRMRRSNR